MIKFLFFFNLEMELFYKVVFGFIFVIFFSLEVFIVLVLLKLLNRVEIFIILGFVLSVINVIEEVSY